jgi:hypothetical protein
MKQYIVSEEEECLLKSIKIVNIPKLSKFLNEKEYLERKLVMKIEEISILTIFNRLVFVGIKGNKDNYVNVSIIKWAMGRRDYNLLFHIPSPLSVLKMQSEGKRVITMFLQKEELETHHVAMLSYMEGMQLHKRDSFEFLLHDIKHMELFYDPKIHLEQVWYSNHT